MLRRIRESEAVWLLLDDLTRSRGLSERTIAALYDAVYGLRVRNSVYRASLAAGGEEISDQVSGRDLKTMAAMDLLVAHGERRGRYYTAGKALIEMRNEIRAGRAPRDETDPFDAAPLSTPRADAVAQNSTVM
jgi:hypothetical protein